ncbi:MAG TPA: hypothetical protein VNS88_07245 [Nitrospiraceae bacterium]|nr:hypothetical protein [Nitrospiraceae bacterium]
MWWEATWALITAPFILFCLIMAGGIVAYTGYREFQINNNQKDN